MLTLSTRGSSLDGRHLHLHLHLRFGLTRSRRVPEGRNGESAVRPATRGRRPHRQPVDLRDEE